LVVITFENDVVRATITCNISVMLNTKIGEFELQIETRGRKTKKIGHKFRLPIEEIEYDVIKSIEMPIAIRGRGFIDSCMINEHLILFGMEANIEMSPRAKILYNKKEMEFAVLIACDGINAPYKFVLQTDDQSSDDIIVSETTNAIIGGMGIASS